MAVVQKCMKNFDNFKKWAGDQWQEYRDFWSTQRDADEGVDQEGHFYNLWKSDYIVGVVKEPGGHAALKVYNTSAKDDEEYVAFSCKSPEVIKAFEDFLNGVVKFTMKDVIEKQKAAMAAKKAADAQKKKEEAKAKKEAKLDAFLSESTKKNLNESFAKVRKFARDWPEPYKDELEATIDGEYGKAAQFSLMEVETEDELYQWWENHFEEV